MTFNLKNSHYSQKIFTFFILFITIFKTQIAQSRTSTGLFIVDPTDSTFPHISLNIQRTQRRFFDQIKLLNLQRSEQENELRLSLLLRDLAEPTNLVIFILAHGNEDFIGSRNGQIQMSHNSLYESLNFFLERPIHLTSNILILSESCQGASLASKLQQLPRTHGYFASGFTSAYFSLQSNFIETFLRWAQQDNTSLNQAHLNADANQLQANNQEPETLTSAPLTVNTNSPNTTNLNYRAYGYIPLSTYSLLDAYILNWCRDNRGLSLLTSSTRRSFQEADSSSRTPSGEYLRNRILTYENFFHGAQYQFQALHCSPVTPQEEDSPEINSLIFDQHMRSNLSLGDQYEFTYLINRQEIEYLAIQNLIKTLSIISNERVHWSINLRRERNRILSSLRRSLHQIRRTQTNYLNDSTIMSPGLLSSYQDHIASSLRERPQLKYRFNRTEWDPVTSINESTNIVNRCRLNEFRLDPQAYADRIRCLSNSLNTNPFTLLLALAREPIQLRCSWIHQHRSEWAFRSRCAQSFLQFANHEYQQRSEEIYQLGQRSWLNIHPRRAEEGPRSQ